MVGFQGTSPWIITGSVQASISPAANQSVSGTVTVNQGSNAGFGSRWPVILTNGSQSVDVSSTSMLSVAVNNVPSVNANLTNTNVNVSGSVVGFQGTNPWVIGSIVGTYAEDTGHTTGDKGLFVLGVRNDTVASLVSADVDYSPMAMDSAGRSLVRPFAPEESRVEGYASVVSTSVTTLVAAAGAGLRNYITDVIMANSGNSTTLVTFKDGAGSILGYTMVPAGGGSNMIGFNTPIRTGANATFDFQPTTATSILFATVKGYKAP